MGSVNITLANGQLGGVIQTSDGVCGMILTGVSEGSYAVGTPVLLTSVASLVTATISVASNPFAHRQVVEFYKEAGDGAQLYLMLVANTYPVQDICNIEAEVVKTLIDYSNGKIRLLGVMTNDQAVYDGDVTTAMGINDDVYDAIPALQFTAEDFAGKQRPFRAIIGGTSYNGSAGALDDLTEYAANRVSVLIGNTAPGGGACLGLILGRLATLPVQRKVSRVKNGGMKTTTAYLGTGTVESVADTVTAIENKGFITFKTYPQTGGYFISGDPTASPPGDDYNLLARGRIMDKVQLLTYKTFVQEIDDEVKINDDGTLDAAYCKWLSTQIENQINNAMKQTGEISSVTCFIDPAQNILSTNTLNVGIGILPVGYSNVINITLKYVTRTN